MRGFRELFKSWKDGCPWLTNPNRFDLPKEGLKPLSVADPGKKFKVCRILGGRSACARLAHMGIYPGVEVELLCGGCNAPCIVKVHNVTISLGHGISQKILVEEAGG
ncbi:MAG: ferrous iron transport protein A [Syntrophobacterales bacterium]|nr:ferrous iron transport protein A [Syntrophobacterales bacterium]